MNNKLGFNKELSDENDEWLTPLEIIKALGEFDIDPCSPINRPWNTAKKHYNINDDGLKQEWEGRIWCNPPYGKKTKKWLKKLSKHNNGIALIFARTETKNFFDYIWENATAILFIKGRLKFYDVKGIQSDNAGAPSCLIAYGKKNAEALHDSKIKGKYIKLK